jgi:hypothetical protein
MSHMVSYSRIPSQDLFPTKGPVAPRQMIGREEEVTALVAQLAGGSHQVLAGPRRTGKTSVCDAAVARLRSSGSYVVSVDLFQVESLTSLAELIARRALTNRSAVKQALPALTRAARRVGRAAQVSATLHHEFGTDIEFAFAPLANRKTPDAQFDFALALLEKLAVADGHSLVLYLDEFQEIEVGGRRFGDPDLLTKKMRAILQRSPHVTCLFAGSIEHMMREIFTPKSRAMYQFAGFFTLDPIDEDDWRRSLRKVYLRDETTITDEALDALLQYSEAAARATMLIAQQSHVVAVEKGSFVVGVTEVIQGLGYAMSAELPTHEGEVSRIRGLRVHALAVAQRLARGEAPYGGDLDDQQVRRALNSLRTAGIAVHIKTGDWRIVDPLLSRYLDGFATY